MKTKTDGTRTKTTSRQPLNSLVSLVLGNCLCDPLELAETRGWSPATQFVELHGIRFIGLGALMDELTCHERVYDTLEQLTTRSERMISIGYIVEGDVSSSASRTGTANNRSSCARPSDDATVSSSAEVHQPKKAAEAVPLDVWAKNYPNNEKNMSVEVKKIIQLIKSKQYDESIKVFRRQLGVQRAFPARGNNLFLAGITAHNLAVTLLLNGEKPDAIITMFKDAITYKELAFGPDHIEVAFSWDELGVQLFATGDFEQALVAFRQAHRIRSGSGGSGTDESNDHESAYAKHPSMAMVLNNMACCNFQMKSHRSALVQLEDARQVHQEVSGSTAQADLDLLHVAIVMCNCGYLYMCLKEYEKASSLLEEALLVQQSVLDENHRAIRDTRTNIEFTNAFHS